MEPKTITVWDVLFNGDNQRDALNEVKRLHEEGLLNSPIVRYLLCVAGNNIPFDESTTLEFFLATTERNPDASDIVKEVYQRFDTYTSDSFIRLVLQRGVSLHVSFVSNYLVDRVKDTEMFDPVLSWLLSDGQPCFNSTFNILVILLVRLVCEGHISYNDILTKVSIVGNNTKYALVAAFDSLDFFCDTRHQKYIIECLLGAVAVSTERLEALINTYYKYGVTCERLFNAYSYLRSGISYQDNVLRIIEEVIVRTCYKSLVDFDETLLEYHTKPIVKKIIDHAATGV